MKPKEKAKELVDTYWDELDMGFINSKKCALIAVDEILKSHYELLQGIKQSTYDYYLEVKREIAKL